PFAVLSVVALFPTQAQTKPSSAQSLPPLIDRELIFGNPEIAGASLSPDGKFLAFMKPWNDTRNIWVKRVDEPFEKAKLLTGERKRPIPAFLWTRDSKQIIYVRDNDGDENFNVYAVDPHATAEAGIEYPASRDLTGTKGVRVTLYSLPKNEPDIAYIGLNDRDKAWYDLYKLKISTGEKTLVRKNTERIGRWIFDNSGVLRLASRTDSSGEQETLRVDKDGFSKIYSCNVFENCPALRFHKDGKRVYMQSDKGDVNLSELLLLDPETGKTEKVESDPLKRVDFGGARFSENTDELQLTIYVDDKPRRYFRDKSMEADYKWLQSKLPGREIGMPSMSLDEKTWLVSSTSDVEPGETYLFDRTAKKLTLQYRTREKLPRQALSPMVAIKYPSSDGLEIPAYLTYPTGLPRKNLPVVVVPHGGPWARDFWGYSSIPQFLANRGYAVLQPNFRGSTGYGKKFLNAGNREWGRKMQDDITWGVKYLIAQGIADPKRIGIMGISYGGYATLAGVAFTPELYRAGVDIVGPSNLITLLEAIPPYWESDKKIMFTRMADPGTPEGKDWLKERSPLTDAKNIKTPLMVVQGANDPRVNRAEAEQIVVALRDRDFPVEYLLANDEGHGFQRPVNSMAMFMAAEKFLAKHLDGRYQEGGKPEVVARLKEITVDPKTVVLTRKVDSSKVTLPKVLSDPKPGTSKYDVKIAMAGREVAMKLTRTVAEENGGFTATDMFETPSGSMTDSVQLEKGTLAVRKRSFKQGPIAVDLDFNDSKATGTMSMGDKQKPVSVDLDGPLFADGPAFMLSLSQLPLEHGYSTVFRNFNVQKQKPQLVEFKVVGSETVTVPAGTFDAFRVQTSPLDGGNSNTVAWIAKDTRKSVKVVATMESMGGATMTAELTQ
ncbi:MAG TPA: alpha/beta fold hydrolase, partial [Bryobacteraceae bacterium]|nr:alpha/beta fold hydrolase [Bryobacteraceae bacterium]